MENNKRAEQFIPFDALKGFKEEIRKRELVIVEKIILSEEDERKLNYYLTQIKIGYEVEIVYFKDGQYIKIRGIVTNINDINKTLRIVKTEIKIDDILSIDSPYFNTYEE